jgi:hypothetical protein
MYRVRFHLALGENYRMWQIRGPEQVFYADPVRVSLRMTNCRLRNQRGTANKIFAGEDKTVCAWVECESVSVEDRIYHRGLQRQLIYNPRVKPYWTSSEDNTNLDGAEFPLVFSRDRSLFVREEDT